MFASNALPPPASFGHEHRPLRLTSEYRGIQPQGGCHFAHQADQNQRCLCQTYQHNRSTPGNMCDCGHASCYHSQNVNEGRLSPDRVLGALVEKVKKLEEIVVRERESHNEVICNERITREKEARVFREALAPFYRSESDMRKKIADLELKVGAQQDEISHLRGHVASSENAKLVLEQRLNDCELARLRKRKASTGDDGMGVMSPDSYYAASSSSSSTVSDATSVSSQRSPHPPSPLHPANGLGRMIASPRSSGVLHIGAEAKRVNDSHHDPQMQHHLPSPHDEARSSGFLSIDLAERLRTRQTGGGQHQSLSMAAPNWTRPSPPRVLSTGLPSPPQHQQSVGALAVSQLLSDNQMVEDRHDHAMKKRRQHDRSMTGLELLASAATPLAQAG